ncbi:nucleolar protein 12 isoform X2 [Arachis ipaensis]|uniref:nucleolar protein 12 isoform X2 n=1 Tax=Arachis ipaensis TaxID=130454 RepID=UPI000A2B748A|nr:nucleolar protein 12 isoform X2 [Arachis ipaensis]
MGKKKPKDPPQTDLASPHAAAGIFSSLFADAPEASTALASLFSDDNPFRRKPTQPSQESNEQTRIPNNVGSAQHDTGEEKRKRKTLEENPSADSAIEASGKKRKYHESIEEAKGSDLAIEKNDAGKEKKKKKKRKREELEKEWEERKYGAVVDEEKEASLLENGKVGNKRKLLHDPADMMVSKEGFDDEEKLLRTVFVGNLPLKVKKKTLLKEFKKFGEVESVRIRSVPIQDTKKPRKGAILAKKINDAADSVHAYIVFKTEESAQASLSHNMAVVEGNHIRVDRACPPRKKLKGEITPLYDNKRTLFVGNLPFDVKEAANSALKKRNLELRDRELRLSHAKADSTPSKKPKPKPSPAQAPGTPAKRKSLATTSPSSSINRSNKKSNASYQGLRATKSDFKKKAHGVEKSKGHSGKRPSVAARKAKAKMLKESGSSKQAGMKRKLDSRTPDSSFRSKKVKKNR